MRILLEVHALTFVDFHFSGIAFVGHPSFLFSTSLSDEFATADIIAGTILGVVSGIFAAAQYLIVNYTKDQCHWTQVEQTTAALATFIFCPIAAASFMWYGDHYLGDRFYIQFDGLSTGQVLFSLHITFSLCDSDVVYFLCSLCI